MQYDLRIVDPPGWNVYFAISVVVVLGSLAGLASLLTRLVRWRVRAGDVAIWFVAAILGMAFGLASNPQLDSVGFFALATCMGGGAWLGMRHNGELRLIGSRVLEASALVSIVALLVSRP
jgi:hypothetical protein